ncbi:MAG: DUF1761 domain-containing protein [Candidatus Pacebacteria bacterium]|nr:DUF1761 domain-containing protein [Candidatus Paceibacterota bacterium]
MEMNYLALIVCAIVALIIGMLWYGKALFGNMWMKITGMDTMTVDAQAEAKKGMAKMVAVQLVLSFVSAFVLSRFINMSGMSGVTMAFWIWLGFLMPTSGGSALWSGKPKGLAWSMFFITAGAELVTFLAYGFILDMWK